MLPPLAGVDSFGLLRVDGEYARTVEDRSSGGRWPKAETATASSTAQRANKRAALNARLVVLVGVRFTLIC
jgi:hypothetical protein